MKGQACFSDLSLSAGQKLQCSLTAFVFTAEGSSTLCAHAHCGFRGHIMSRIEIMMRVKYMSGERSASANRQFLALIFGFIGSLEGYFL